MNRRGDREKPPNEPGGWRKWLQSTNSALDRIAALSVFALLGRDGQTHLLVQRPADESANAVRLPVCCLHNFSQGSPVLALQQVQDSLGLAAFAGASAFLRLGGLLGLGRFLSFGGPC